MFRNFIKISLRNLVRNKVYSFINIFGLAIGLCCCILLMLYVKHEISYEKHYKNADDLYRIWLQSTLNGKQRNSSMTTLTFGPDMKAEFPEVKNSARISSMQGGLFASEQKEIGVHFLYADNALIEMFSFEVLQGSSTDLLGSPQSLVITKNFAQKLFGDENPIGKSVKFNNDKSLMVTAVIADQPQNTHLKFSALMSLDAHPNQYKSYDGNYSFYTYLQLEENVNVDEFRAKLPAFMEEKINKHARQYGWQVDLNIQNIQKIHLESTGIEHELSASGSKQNIMIYTAIAIFILIIACINFMNLSVAKSLKRAKEIGVRKVLGSYRSMIIRQYIAESVFYTFIAFVVALILFEIFLPPFNTFIGIELDLYNSQDWQFLIALPLIVLLTGLLAGSYPAFYLSAFNPLKVLKGGVEVSRSRFNIKNILVVLQFVISTALIVCTLIIYSQISYLKNKDLGYNKENVLVLQFSNREQLKSIPVLKNKLIQISEIQSVTGISALPVHGVTMNGFLPEGMQKPMMFHQLDVDEHFLETFQSELVAGRNFSDASQADQLACFVNEAGVKAAGWDQAVGKNIERNGKIFKVIGVVKDFHFTSLHKPIAPMVLRVDGQHYRLVMRYISSDVKTVIDKVNAVWDELLPQESIRYSLLNTFYEGMYKDESRFGTIFISFAILAIFIACLGLLGLSSFMLEQRTKEIGVRKVLGASTERIFKLLSLSYVKLLLFSNLIAIPFAWYGMERWLDAFAYRIEMPWWPFVLTFAVSLIIMMLTIVSQTLKSAHSKPVDAIRYE